MLIAVPRRMRPEAQSQISAKPIAIVCRQTQQIRAEPMWFAAMDLSPRLAEPSPVPPNTPTFADIHKAYLDLADAMPTCAPHEATYTLWQSFFSRWLATGAHPHHPELRQRKKQGALRVLERLQNTVDMLIAQASPAQLPLAHRCVMQALCRPDQWAQTALWLQAFAHAGLLDDLIVRGAKPFAHCTVAFSQAGGPIQMAPVLHTMAKAAKPAALWAPLTQVCIPGPLCPPERAIARLLPLGALAPLMNPIIWQDPKRLVLLGHGLLATAQSLPHTQESLRLRLNVTAAYLCGDAAAWQGHPSVLQMLGKEARAIGARLATDQNSAHQVRRVRTAKHRLEAFIATCQRQPIPHRMKDRLVEACGHVAHNQLAMQPQWQPAEELLRSLIPTLVRVDPVVAKGGHLPCAILGHWWSLAHVCLPEEEAAQVTSSLARLMIHTDDIATVNAIISQRLPAMTSPKLNESEDVVALAAWLMARLLAAPARVTPQVAQDLYAWLHHAQSNVHNAVNHLMVHVVTQGVSVLIGAGAGAQAHQILAQHTVVREGQGQSILLARATSAPYSHPHLWPNVAAWLQQGVDRGGATQQVYLRIATQFAEAICTTAAQSELQQAGHPEACAWLKLGLSTARVRHSVWPIQSYESLSRALALTQILPGFIQPTQATCAKWRKSSGQKYNSKRSFELFLGRLRLENTSVAVDRQRQCETLLTAFGIPLWQPDAWQKPVAERGVWVQAFLPVMKHLLAATSNKSDAQQKIIWLMRVATHTPEMGQGFMCTLWEAAETVEALDAAGLIQAIHTVLAELEHASMDGAKVAMMDALALLADERLLTDDFAMGEQISTMALPYAFTLPITSMGRWIIVSGQLAKGSPGISASSQSFFLKHMNVLKVLLAKKKSSADDRVVIAQQAMGIDFAGRALNHLRKPDVFSHGVGSYWLHQSIALLGDVPAELKSACDHTLRSVLLDVTGRAQVAHYFCEIYEKTALDKLNQKALTAILYSMPLEAYDIRRVFIMRLIAVRHTFKADGPFLFAALKSAMKDEFLACGHIQNREIPMNRAPDEAALRAMQHAYETARDQVRLESKAT